MEDKKKSSNYISNKQFNFVLDEIASIIENSVSTKEAAEKIRGLKLKTK